VKFGDIFIDNSVVRGRKRKEGRESALTGKKSFIAKGLRGGED